MASSSNSAHQIGVEGKEEEEVMEEETLEEEELESFDDFTLASSWERFISEIEAVCRQWMSDGPKNLMEKGAECLDLRKGLHKIKYELKYGKKLYYVEYYFENTKNVRDSYWEEGVHELQLSFGVSDFLIFAPLSASGVVLDAPESTKLLSAVAIALTNCGSNWPAFVPVHDPSRKAYIGIQNMGMTYTRRFDADRVGSQVPIRLMHLEGLYELFVSKFVLYSVDFSTSYFQVQFEMKLTYRTTPSEYDYEMESADFEIKESSEDTGGLNNMKSQWDDDCPWLEWYSAEDPIRGFELIAIWFSKTFEGSLEMAELENISTFDAEKWLLYPLVTRNMTDDSNGNFVGFASQLKLLISAFDMSFEAQFMEDFVAADTPASDNLKAVAIPSPTVLDRVLTKIFIDGIKNLNHMELENKSSRSIKGAPLDSLFAQFCLHSLWFGGCNIRAISMLWLEFVREVRWCWEESQSLPKISTDSSIDLSSCLIHQKLQMLALCIGMKNLQNNETDNGSIRKGLTSDDIKEDVDADEWWEPLDDKDGSNKVCSTCGVGVGLKDHTPCCFLQSSPGSGWLDDSIKTVYPSNKHPDGAIFPDLRIKDIRRRGSTGVVRSMKLLHSNQPMHAPFTQSAPVMTEDMHEERLHAVETSGDAFRFSGQLERDVLSSDMSAFKAANPGAVFEDFIRWHSPGDWEADETEESYQDDYKWPPRGKLSQRMAEHGNIWRKIWNDSHPLPVSEQKPILDPIREAEKIIHYLETLRPHQLLEQMVCTAFRAAADTLNQTIYGDLKPMRNKMNQFYLTLSSTLKSFRGIHGNNLSDKSELISDLHQLCQLFEHIEKLLILAASLHRKLLGTPRLGEEIFSDFFNFYLPKMATSLTSMCYDKEFDSKQLVRAHERDAVASLFRPPDANQSWRKVLSMGNLLNGHEPIFREIIFSTCEKVSGDKYASDTVEAVSQDIKTHRMYVCGTSNDLHVALSVTSWD